MLRESQTRRIRLLFVAALGMTILGGETASADIVYLVDRTITGGGDTGTVVGSITTDGTLGILNTSDIIAWILNLNGAGGVTYKISNTDSGAAKLIVGGDVSATATNLFFNFGGSAGYLLLQDGLDSGAHYYCAETGGGACYLGESVVPIYYTDSSTVVSDPVPTGSQILGTAVPEPSTWAMMLLGFAGLGFAGYRASRRSVATAWRACARHRSLALLAKD